jgi:hypothetical protein
MPKLNNCHNGENSPNLATLFKTQNSLLGKGLIPTGNGYFDGVH